MANITPQTQFNNFDIPQGGYAAFDAMSLRQLIYLVLLILLLTPITL